MRFWTLFLDPGYEVLDTVLGPWIMGAWDGYMGPWIMGAWDGIWDPGIGYWARVIPWVGPWQYPPRYTHVLPRVHPPTVPRTGSARSVHGDPDLNA